MKEQKLIFKGFDEKNLYLDDKQNKKMVLGNKKGIIGM